MKFRVRLALTCAALLSAYVGYRISSKSEEDIPNYLQTYGAEMSSSDATGTGATLKFVRFAGVIGNVDVNIPSGTILYSSVAGAQRLILAHSIHLTLSDGTPIISVKVATFCIDEFAAVPPVSTALWFTAAPGVHTATTEETEPLHKLANCMESSRRPADEKQLAVWAVSADLLHKSRADALAFLTDGIATRLASDVYARLALIAKPYQPRPGEDPSGAAQIEVKIEHEYQIRLPGVQKKAASWARTQLDSFLRHDRDLMSSCGYDVVSLPLFQTG